MPAHLPKIPLLAVLLSVFSALTALGQSASAEEQIKITAATPSVDTGQDYSPWLDDNLKNLVQNSWFPGNFRYVDVTLQLAKPTLLTRLSLFDYEGVFPLQPATFYAVSGGKQTYLGSFDGSDYNKYVDLVISTPVAAEAIIVHKYCNNIPVKIKVFGQATGTSTPTPPALVPAVLTFGSLATRTVGDAPFTLAASSTNAATPITYSSSNAGVVAVAATSTGQWQATVVSAGTATITAAQVGSSSFLAAASVSQTLVVQAAATPTPTPIPTPTPTPLPTPTPTGPTVSGKIPIDPTRWYSLTNVSNNIAGLFDGSTSTGITPGWGRVIDPYEAYYPLLPDEAISLESLRMYDPGVSNPTNPMTLSVITDKWERITVATFTGARGGQWQGPDPKNPANQKLSSQISNIRYLVLTASWAYPNELELYGSYVAGTPLAVADPAALARQKQVKLGQEMGVNAFEWDLENPDKPGEIDETRLKGVKNFTGIRHYMDWQKLESTEGGYTFNPVHSGGWNYDVLYERCKKEGIEVLACLKTLPDWMLATYPSDQRDAENVPVRYGKDFADPKSYIEQAKVGFQYIARYGYNTGVPANLLRVDQSLRWAGDGVNQVKIGLGYIKYIECDNERDKWWKGRKAYQTGREYAANLSAFYDGHLNTMGAGVGVKNADPSVQVVMGGIASPNPDYVRGMIDWCRQYRGLKADGSVNLCWDIINYHLYSNDEKSSQSGNPTRGAAPEVSEAAQVAQRFVQMAHQYARDMPVWITETGYDTNQGSPLKAIAVGGKSVLQTQADWLLRTALLYARWGVERTFFYQLADDNPNSAVQFSSMGLVNADRSPKPAADFLRQTTQLLGNFAYQGTLNNDPLVDRYTAGNQTAYSLVIPDEKGRTATYTLNVGTDSARIYQPQAGQINMKVTRVRTQGGQLQLTVTETPTFVLTGPSAAVTTPATSCPGTGSIQWEQWQNSYGLSVNDIPTQRAPDQTATLLQLESSRNIGDNYGARIRGYICAPQDGNYTFRISGDDVCQLWLSTDDNPTHKIQIAKADGYTGFRQWDKFASQQSAPVALLAGHRYYVEVLHKEQGGDDFVSVAWTLPNGQIEAPIAGSHLVPLSSATSLTNSETSSLHTTLSASDEATPAGPTPPGLAVYPNPFTDQTTVSFSLAKAGAATLGIYDVQNRLISQLYAGSLEAGTSQHFTIKSATLPVGMYLIRLITPGKVFTQKLVRID
ncbi:T9SS type A sorting domain-containing protein [Hymenobacter sp. HMF4947]|uniref:T9SS type A sorting domain-containing protein n=1 Tax=Hymenobacter ginkgonis TaxID=2682976 RepID=A0A7K1TF20_9BACT|nr:PA14 domain-containing protein [Hymenobacter ginkgonis]MVN76985.1 T9SS type A sorting domain-containing protein [Hymenobacter ginkgonis]